MAKRKVARPGVKIKTVKGAVKKTKKSNIWTAPEKKAFKKQIEKTSNVVTANKITEFTKDSHAVARSAANKIRKFHDSFTSSKEKKLIKSAYKKSGPRKRKATR